MTAEPRPLTRARCIDGPRPCPYISCRHHLALEVNHTGTLVSHLVRHGLRVKVSAEQVEAWTDALVDAMQFMPDTCSLDVADRQALTLHEVGEVLGMVRERARQIEVRALMRMKLGLKTWKDHEPSDTAGPAEMMIREAKTW